MNHGSDRIHAMKFICSFLKTLRVGVFEVWFT